MSKKLIGRVAVAVAAALCMAAPAWAHHDGHGNGYGHWKHGHGNGYGNDYGHWKHGHGHQVRERVVVREYVNPAPAYSQAVYPAYQAPAPGIHFVLPDLFIPFR